tara:strand:+ start:1245 stop:1685 length:441 start_codon:yes stop_codon:yes gene_type:complete
MINNTIKKIKHLQKSINSLKKMVKTKLKKRKSKRTARGKKTVTKSDQISASSFKIKPSIGKKTETRKQKQLKHKLKNIIENVIQQQRRARFTGNIPLTLQQRQRERERQRFQTALSVINPNGQTIPILGNEPNFIRPTRQFASVLR